MDTPISYIFSNSNSSGRETEKQELENDRKINQMMKADNDVQAHVYKLLLLGAGESGKSTLFKQINSIHGNGISPEDLRSSITPIHNNIHTSINALCLNVGRWGQVLPENEALVAAYASSSNTDDSLLTERALLEIKQLWADPAIQLAWQQRNLFQIYDSAAYFFDQIDNILSPTYTPTLQDYLRIRVRTTGIVESEFSIEQTKFRMFDVGGQRNERKKWIHCFENVRAVIFVAAISEYDQRLFEDETTNRMVEAIRLFEEICNSRWFKHTSMILFLNKRDLFEQKILISPLAQHFPDYNGPSHNAAAAHEWIAQQFLSKKASPTQTVYKHYTCATDTNNIKAVFHDVKDIVIREQLVQAGLQ